MNFTSKYGRPGFSLSLTELVVVPYFQPPPHTHKKGGTFFNNEWEEILEQDIPWHCLKLDISCVPCTSYDWMDPAPCYAYILYMAYRISIDDIFHQKYIGYYKYKYEAVTQYMDYTLGSITSTHSSEEVGDSTMMTLSRS